MARADREQSKKLERVARALITGGVGDAKAQDEALAAFGLVLEGEQAEHSTEVWPDNWQTMLVFADMLSQWNVGMGGVIGLRYESLSLVFRMHGIKSGQQRDIFDGLRVMERAAVKQLNER